MEVQVRNLGRGFTERKASMITENQLDNWVRGNARDAQGVVVELVYRLWAAACPKPRERRIPLPDSIGQSGTDGILDTAFSYDPFVPEGKSFWEIGTGANPGDKATSDYNTRTQAVPEPTRLESAFIFVTPLSAVHGWTQGAQAAWKDERKSRHEWRDVRVIDGTILTDWLRHFPAVELWLARKMGLPPGLIQTTAQRWVELKGIGSPPPLIPEVFLVNRTTARQKLDEIFARTAVQLRLDTHYPKQVPDFVAAHVAAMDDEARLDIESRCLIISEPNTWQDLLSLLQDAHFLVPNFDVDTADPDGTTILERSRRANHAVIYGSPPGGTPHGNRVTLPNPKVHELNDALRQAGYKEERARLLAQNSEGHLTSLLRCLQGVSVAPEWAQDTAAAELVVVHLLGSWNEANPADIAVVEVVSKKSYGEWIQRVREALHRPATPLTHQDGVWKATQRYEAWYALGPKIFDDQLDRLRQCAVTVLREQDPKFELAPDDRPAASIHGKVLSHSVALRKGLADTLALLGSYPKALTSASFGKAEQTTVLTVRDILKDADWVVWASLNQVLPLLAEAAPGEFLDAVESALHANPCPFDRVFAEEGGGFGGWNYMTGLLWALETLAWDGEYLTRCLVILGELGARDPGGNWSNRPSNSLTTILLPWFPQTCASLEKRKAAVTTLLREVPAVGWKLLLDLLPSAHGISSGSRKPAWRQTIPDDWNDTITTGEYWRQVEMYGEMTVAAAIATRSRLAELIPHIDNLLPPLRDALLTQLSSEPVLTAPEAERFQLWTELEKVIHRHRKFSDAQWALKPPDVEKIAAVSNQLAPQSLHYRYHRLFDDADIRLYEEVGNYTEQSKRLEEKRAVALNEMMAAGGFDAVTDFANTVKSPWRIGGTLGAIGTAELDRRILPSFLLAESKPLAQLAANYVFSRFRIGGQWTWADAIDTQTWSNAEKGQFFAYLPFMPATWDRASRALGEDDREYWSRANANPYDTEEDIGFGIDKLADHGRAHAALECLEGLRHKHRPMDPKRIVRVLLALLHSGESPGARDDYAVPELIKLLQEDPQTDPNDLFRIEWSFLPVLDDHHGASPRTLSKRLAEDPSFFCEVIRLVFRSRNPPGPVAEPTADEERIAGNAYRLLHRWNIPPGLEQDGSFSGTKLVSWLDRVKDISGQSGHLEVSLNMIGTVLMYSPPDPDGLWIHSAAAEVLNARDADQMRKGFSTQLFNSRGVHHIDPQGTGEDELAENYHQKGEELEARGYHRLANTLKDLATQYRRDAGWIRTHNRFDD